MKRTHGRVVHLSTRGDLEDRLARGARTLSTWRVHGVDLRGLLPDLLARDVDGATFLGCDLAPDEAAALAGAGALVMPTVGDTPLEVYRSTLYSARELYGTGTYADSLDARAYAWAQQGSREDELAATLHDHAIDEALQAWRDEGGDRRLVGVMGGHAAARGTASYRDAARLGRLLAGHGMTVATGGGPGAMEAANLGARLGSADEAALDVAVTRLAAVPDFRPSIQAWLAPAWEVIETHADAVVASLGVPTWHYGHEPPNPFATAIAKYVRNATREAVLLEVCDGGIAFLPGAAGTVQEVFQDACENYYADESSLAPMVLVGHDHWTRVLPAWPLLQALARGRAMEEHVHLVDSVEEAAAVLGSR